MKHTVETESRNILTEYSLLIIRKNNIVLKWKKKHY